ncbi:MAG TPA: hypothetical protein DCP97_00480 [Ruminococcaceae bacterium]|nr:hypothetical protein [Oscillospiraceae bacterium]
MQKIISFIKSDSFKKMIKFGITGVSNTVVDFCIFTLLYKLLLVDKYTAQVIGYSAGILNSYIINRSWTFKSSQSFLSLQLVKFVAVNLCMLGLSLALIWFFADMLGLSAMVAKLLATAIIMLVNFIVSKLWVFAEKRAR